MPELEKVNVHPFAGAPVISAYSRAQALEDGVLVDVSSQAEEAGFKVPVAVTTAVWALCVPSDAAAAAGESEIGRLWDVLWMCVVATRRLQAARRVDDTIYFSVEMTDAEGKKRLHNLWAKCGPGDEAEPVVTIMLRGED
ncbi:MAG TPA: DUF6573 family protein [Stellaceae bacterium]|nr:DUF6573 family protein [Stellaceae bacterium]